MVAVWVTLPADFLRYPAWLAAQKADFVIGPVLTGVYWIRRRPQSPFGPMLICWGLVGALYILQSSSDSWLFSIGLFWEKVFGLGTYVLILAFPTGRFDRVSKVLLAVGVVTVLLVGRGHPARAASGRRRRFDLQLPGAVPTQRARLHVGPGAGARPVRGVQLCRPRARRWRSRRWSSIASSPVRRRGGGRWPSARPSPCCSCCARSSISCSRSSGADDSELYGIVIWVFVAARAAVWYGFLFALIAAQLFAARAMERLLEQSLNHPSKQELEVMLREPLGDPQLRLQFLPDGAKEPDAERRAVEAGPGRDVTVVQRDGSPPVAIVHDAQLNDDPELLNAAGAIALLAAENAELDAGWKEAMRDLERSRTRLVRAADEERRKVERNLHDGVQHQLIAIMIRLGMAAEDATVDGATRDRLTLITGDVEEALEEVRAVSHGLYPPVLLDLGLVAALQSVQRRTPVPLSLDADGVGRYSPEVESAVYYACLEAIQNATKHGGPDPASP